MAGTRKVSVAKPQGVREPREERQERAQQRVDPKRITEAFAGFTVDNLLKIGKVITRLINRKLDAQALELGLSKRELAAMRKRAAAKVADPWAEFDGIEFVPSPRASRRKRGAA